MLRGGYPLHLASQGARKGTKVQQSDPDNVPVKTVQVGADSSRTTRIAGDLGEK